MDHKREAQPAGAPSDSRLTKELVIKIVNGMMTTDPGVVCATTDTYFHQNALLIQHLAQARGRDDIYSLFRADSALFDIQHKVVDVGVDQDKLLAFAWVDQSIKPRLPRLLQSLLPAVSCPVLTRLTFQAQPDGRLMIVEQYDHVSTFYLSSLLGPVGRWLHWGIIMPAGMLVCRAIASITDAARAAAMPN